MVDQKWHLKCWKCISCCCKNSIAGASVVVFNCLQNPMDADSAEHIETHTYIPMNYAAHCCWPLLSLDIMP